VDYKLWARCLKVLPYLGMVVVLTALYGIFTRFLPSAVYSTHIQIFSFVFSCLLVIISYVTYFKKCSHWRQNLKGRQSVWVTVLIIPLVLFLIPYMSFTIGCLRYYIGLFPQTVSLLIRSSINTVIMIFGGALVVLG
jgi:uncharacterized membrane protein